uniref:hypothetical protein n=1 Tax=uncultured Dialister sp. TaxID=278064 RepID=UPI00266F4420
RYENILSKIHLHKIFYTTDRYLLLIVSYASSTEILRFAQNDEPGGKGAAKRHTYSSPKAIPPLNPLNRHAHQGVSNGDTTTLGGEDQ